MHNIGMNAAIEARQARSGALFNNRHFADVAGAALAISRSRSDMLTVRMIASWTGLADSVVRPVLLRLVEANVFEKLPRAGAARGAQYYRILEPTTLGGIQKLVEPDDRARRRQTVSPSTSRH